MAVNARSKKTSATQTEPKKIVIACQGGGSHNAFTAGVLQTLLRNVDRTRYQIVGISGTSGGGFCAALAWHGWLIDQPEQAAEHLQIFWETMSAQSFFDRLVNAAVIETINLGQYVALPLVSPYQVPSVALDRIAQTMKELIPFDELPKLIKPASPTLLVGAVNVLSGKFTVFRSGSSMFPITLDALLASGSLPTVTRATHIGDNVYWDGLFSENPPIRGFIAQQQIDVKPDEIWLIRIEPETYPSEPTSIVDIVERRGQLSSNLSLGQSLDFVQQVNDWLARGLLTGEQFKHIELRSILINMTLDPTSRADRSPAFIQRLIRLGNDQASAFLQMQ